jgi:phosphate-selective porin OprO/OprP
MNVKGRHWRMAAVAAATLVPIGGARAEVTMEELLKRIEQQEQKILALERRLETAEGSAKAPGDAAPTVSAGPRGFSLRSADERHQLRLRGLLHVDGRYLENDDPAGLTDTWQATRVRPTFEGTLGGIYDFRFTPDFGQGRTVIQDAYVTAKLNPAFQVTAGKFKSPVGLERLQSASDIRFVSRAFPTSLAPNRDLGLQFAGELGDGRLNYAFAWLNGSNDGGSSEAFGDVDINDDQEYALRLFARPFAQAGDSVWRGLGVGIAATYADQQGTAAQPLLPAFRTPGQSTFFRYRGDSAPTLADGDRTRIAPQFYYYVGSFGLLGEYTEVSQDVARTTGAELRAGTVDTSAWQLAASWFLSGEEAAYRGFRPKSVFTPGEGGWGAFEFVARVHRLEIDELAFAGGLDSFADPETSARKATAFGVGLNWYLNENLRWALDYERTRFDGGAPGGADREDEDAVLLRVALGF